MNQTVSPIFDQNRAADYLGISKYQLLDLFRRGELPGKKIGPKTFRFHREDLDSWIRNGKSVVKSEV